ncbi:MAG: Lar family restriction alleviation protein [Fretibacterium sp.]|nr:Lar family restriction alleviation protein [Fretibacterium sp.]
MAEILSPCPHCGGRDAEFRYHAETKDGAKHAYGGLYCKTEGCGGAVVFNSHDGITKRQARKICTEKWNRRINEDE